MARTSRNVWSATARDISEIEQLLRQLEGRLEKLGASATSDARHAGAALPGMISDALANLSEHFREIVHDNARNVGNEAARVGTAAWHKVEDEIGHRPLATLAVAASIGFLFGLLGRRG